MSAPVRRSAVDEFAWAIARVHGVFADWRATRELIEKIAPAIVRVDESDGEARYYGVTGAKLVRCMVADRVLVALGHPQFDGDEDQAALMSWCAEWTREWCLQ
jgi:hypothetical protein